MHNISLNTICQIRNKIQETNSRNLAAMFKIACHIKFINKKYVNKSVYLPRRPNREICDP